MDYTRIQLPIKTVKLLEKIDDHDGKLNPLLVVGGSSDDENWPRIQQLLDCNLIRQEQAYTDDGKIADGSVLWIEPQGKAYLSDCHEQNVITTREKRNEWIRYGITTAIAIAALIKSFFF